jgi:chemotaxis protein methyltransferase CheR
LVDQVWPGSFKLGARGCMNEETEEPVIDEEGYEDLKVKIGDERGLDTRQYKDKFLKRRFKARMRACGVTSYIDYMTVLDTDPNEYQRLFDKLTINVTEFFRNPEMWDYFRRTVLPNILDEPERKRIVRIWSAGCSSGEEVYTIAMHVDQYLWNKNSNIQVVIRGSDLDEDAIRKAREARYTSDKVRKVPEIYKKLYLTFDGEQYHVKDNIKKLVRLVRHDLIGGKKFKYFDAIFCRNVIIYFTRDQQTRLFRDFHKALTMDGYMIIGKTETLVGESKSLFDVVSSQERIYRKKA